MPRKLPNVKFNIRIESEDDMWHGVIELVHRIDPTKIVHTFVRGRNYKILTREIAKSMVVAMGKLKEGDFD